MRHSDDDTLHELFELLGVETAAQVELARLGTWSSTQVFYRAIAGRRWTYVDRAVAALLRQNGSAWSGAADEDPSAVA